MTELFKICGRHKGKATAGTLALVVFLLARGCDVRVHIDPVHARTNTVTAPGAIR